MQLGKVIGTVVTSTVVEGLEGVRLLLVQPLTRDGRAVGAALVAADAVSMAGPGERVYYVSSREAALALEPSFVPVDDAIVGLVEQVHPEGRE